MYLAILWHLLESSEKRRNLIISEQQKSGKPALVQALACIKAFTEKEVERENRESVAVKYSKTKTKIHKRITLALNYILFIMKN